MKPLKTSAVPRCFLYGDPLDDVELDFLHIEPIRERSGKHDWTIRAHSHPDHVQILLVEHGGGTMRVEEREFDVPPLSLIVVPAAMVHEFYFRPDTDGVVMNAATAYVTTVAHGDNRLHEALNVPAVYSLSGDEMNERSTIDAFRWANQEYVWAAPGRRAAIMGHFLRILVTIMRLRRENLIALPSAADREYDILCRYRAELEDHFRAEKSVEFYAARLHISAQRLNQACKARAGKTSSEVLYERIIVEAKRCLIYLERSVAEVGYELGFDDPAYFSRFFSQRVGMAPSAYRKQVQGGQDQRQSA